MYIWHFSKTKTINSGLIGSLLKLLPRLRDNMYLFNYQLFLLYKFISPISFIWFGLVWFGLVWFGLVWFGLVWFGLVWFGLVWFGLV